MSPVMELVSRAANTQNLYPFYKPVRPLPWVFAAIIIVLGIVNYWQNFFVYKWYRFGAILTWASAIWFAGFLCLGLSEAHPTSIGAYSSQYALLLVGPPVYGASETFILGRLMAYLPYHAVMHPARVVSTFVILSTLTAVITAVGGGLVADGKVIPGLLLTGENMVVAGLLIQCFIEVFFLTLTAQLHIKARREKTFPHQVKVMICILYLTSTMLLARCIFRTVQGFQLRSCILTDAKCGKAVTIEALYWIFEVANITLFVVALTVFTPGKYLPPNDMVFLDRHDSKTERLGPGYSKKDNRSLVQTVIDPFDVRRSSSKDAPPPFWEDPCPPYEDIRRSKH